jgi:protein gp37
MTNVDIEYENEHDYRGDGAPVEAELTPEVSALLTTVKPSAGVLPSVESSSALERCETEIRKYFDGILAAYYAQYLRDNELYEEKGYDSVTKYIKQELDIAKSQWYNLLGCADVRDILEDNSKKVEEHLSTAVEEVPLPERVNWTIPLKKHTGDPDLVCRLWAAVLNRLDDITEDKVENVVDDLTDDDDSPETEEATDDGSDGVVTEADGSEASQSGDADEGQEVSGEKSADTSATNNTSNGGEAENAKEDKDAGEADLREELRELHAPLLDHLNDGVARGLLSIADLVAGDESFGQDELRTARESLESLSHRGVDDEDEESNLPGCITSDLDTIDDQEILIAMPTELVPPEMARKALPIGVPQMQYAVGVPLAHFDGRPPVKEFREFYEEQERSFGFNDTNENVDWADYTHNPITGCLHDCAYCYAWYQAEDLELYKQGFQPTFFPGRLSGFSKMEPPEETNHPREKNVFVGSMSDIFGKWVPNWMIQSILDEVEENDGFDYLFLTKFPQKLSQFDFPNNAWVGTTVDKKYRVALAERHFKQVDAAVKWLSCEPLLENVAPEFDELSMFDCVVIGAQQEMGQEVEEQQPKLEWVIELYQKAREAGCKVYFKENLDVFPKELPGA